MSRVVKGVLGLLCSKLRDYTAEKLSDGDLNDEQWRQIVVRELDDIKSKLVGLSRKDLLASLHFFKEGVTRFYSCLERSSGPFDEASTSKPLVDQTTVEGATAMTQHDFLKTASELSNAIGKLKIVSHDRYESAQRSFRESLRLATEAFSNVALNTEDKVMASKLRIASRILESLDDPEAAVTDCLLYLKDLQDLSSVQATFLVWKDSEKNVRTSIRARFNNKNRNVIVESIQLMNSLLLDIVVTFTNVEMAFFQWPTIKIGNEIHHPLTQNKLALGRRERNDLNVPWIWKFPLFRDGYFHCVVTSKGEILSPVTQDSLVITKRSGEKNLFTNISSRDIEDTKNVVAGLTIDENDNVYVVVRILSLKNHSSKAKLVIFDANGKEKSSRFLDDLVGSCHIFLASSISEDGMVVIFLLGRRNMFVYDTKGTRQDYKFVLPDKVECSSDVSGSSLTFSKTNTIFFASPSRWKAKLCINIITVDGKVKRSLKVPFVGYLVWAIGAVFDHVNETFLLGVPSSRELCRDGSSSSIGTTIYSFSDTGDLLGQIIISNYYGRLLSHPNGHVILLNDDRSEAISLLLRKAVTNQIGNERRKPIKDCKMDFLSC